MDWPMICNHARYYIGSVILSHNNNFFLSWKLFSFVLFLISLLTVTFQIKCLKIIFCGFKGSFNWVKKAGTSQCAVNLNFNTNRFEGLLTGYVVLKEPSWSTNMKMVYKFEKSEQETLKVKLTFGDRSTKYMNKYIGSVQLESTAHPEINFLFSLKYQVLKK